MTKFLVAMMVAMVTMLAASCGDTETIYEDSVPMEVTGVVEFVPPPDTCLTNDDCDDLQICHLSDAYTKKAGYKISICILGCKGEFMPVENEDGTSANPKKPGTDTCQRFGDTTLYCDVGNTNECKEYTVEEPVVDPTDPDPDVTPEPDVEPTDGDNTEVMCCYDPADIAAQGTKLYGDFSYSTSTPTNPEGWKQAPNLDIKSDGCFSMMVCMGNVYKGFWVDMTRGLWPDDDTEIPANFWVGESAKPEACYIGGKSVQVGKFDAGWELGPAVSADRQ